MIKWTLTMKMTGSASQSHEAESIRRAEGHS